MWFCGKELKRQKFPEKKIFRFFKSTNYYSKPTFLIADNQKTMVWWNFLNPIKSLLGDNCNWTSWQNFLSTCFLKFPPPRNDKSNMIIHKTNRSALIFKFSKTWRALNIKLIVVSINACFNPLNSQYSIITILQ